MKWYKKQLDALKKNDASPTKERSAVSFTPPDLRGHKIARSPVAQRNRNRKKTDSK